MKMSTRTTVRLAAAGATLVLLGAAPDPAGLTILCGGAAQAAMNRIVAEYQHDRGTTVTLSVGTAGQLRDKLAAGTQADIVIITTTAMNALQQAGTVTGSPTLVGTTSIGVGIPAGAKAPDVRTTAAFEATLRAANRIAVPDPASGASSGIAFAALLKRLGIATEIAPKEILVPGGEVCEVVGRGGADLCIQNVTEIVPVAGVTLAGALPESLQTHLTYVGGVLARAANAAAAQDFLHYATSGERAEVLRAAGFTLPAVAQAR
jgi:molybdate transport system substrate-binding protein